MPFSTLRFAARCSVLACSLANCAHSAPSVRATSAVAVTVPVSVHVHNTVIAAGPTSAPVAALPAQPQPPESLTEAPYEETDPNDPTAVFAMPRLRVDRTPMPSGARMLSGSWTDAPPAARSAVSFDANADSFTFRQPAGVGFDRALRPDNDGALRVSATIDPVAGDTASLGWIAFVFTPRPDGAGWPTNDEHPAAILVRSNGAIQVFSRGDEHPARWEQGPPTAASDYRVSLTLRASGSELVLAGVINEARFTASLGRGSASLGGRAMNLDLCAHYHEAPTASRVSELRASSGRLW